MRKGCYYLSEGCASFCCYHRTCTPLCHISFVFLSINPFLFSLTTFHFPPFPVSRLTHTCIYKHLLRTQYQTHCPHMLFFRKKKMRKRKQKCAIFKISFLSFSTHLEPLFPSLIPC
ncbi:hypothetical protein, unlikely [Trypanosoma brucei gambiense DAL972]|uniref:Uncharacterized protein n=1 Tax=Trypanosoma brucei gambiense (strain MHOM/CI/86/DAL972) TaxID=679716 RepID=D0A5N5_TRYB9|nr:hypothetical protein, unlikely [Trypanosoma brucei gambiense DAL972]CBH16986.1 hypothetical protein, unlikely [Trypanosoma brucei gambiense DAL972]|eukprot:XP_011779250.1 hypothetical protein, unlikely [Trypanosoma brucei gambiense DAL972]